MKATINFVRGAVGTKDLLPILKHIHSYNGRIQAGDGRICIDTPCPELKNLNFTTLLEPFLKAIDACDTEPQLSMDSGKLLVKCKNFKVQLPLGDCEEYPRQIPQQNKEPFSGLLKSIKHIPPFIATDGTRPWACGVCFKDSKLYATNNISLISYPAPLTAVPINIPSYTINELLRISSEPVALACNVDKATFFYSDDSWLQTSLFANDWPDVEKMLSHIDSEPIPKGLSTDVERLMLFVPDDKLPFIITSKDGLSTDKGLKSATCSEYILPDSKFNGVILASVLKVSTHFNFKSYPAPCYFYNESTGARGIMLGIRQ